MNKTVHISLSYDKTHTGDSVLKSFIATEEFLDIPMTGRMYRVNRTGQIYDLNDRLIELNRTHEGQADVDLYWINGFRSYRLAFVLLVTFKPLSIPVKEWSRLDILFLDNNPENLSLDNLIWKYPCTGIESNRFKGFYHIPGFSKYVINTEGCVIRHFDGNVLVGVAHEMGYRYITLTPDVKNGKRAPTVGRHRLLAFTFLDYPANADSLDVNHINGVPGDDRTDNLEWSSRSQNCIHAYASGLRADNKEVLVTNVVTGEKTKYFSAHECERALGLKRSNVHYRIKSGSVYPPGLRFEYVNNIARPKKEAIEVSLRVLSSGELIEFPSMRMCAKFVGLSKKVIQKHFLNKDVFVYRNYEFSKKKSSQLHSLSPEEEILQ